MIRKFAEQLASTRFVIIQEGIWIGVAAAVAKTFWEKFPIEPLYFYLAPIILGAYGLKSYFEHKGEKNGTQGKSPGTLETPGVPGQGDVAGPGAGIVIPDRSVVSKR